MIGIIWISYGPPPPPCYSFFFACSFDAKFAPPIWKKTWLQILQNPFTKLTQKNPWLFQTFFSYLSFSAMSPTSSLGVATVRWNHAAPLSRSQQRSRRHGDAQWRAGGLPPEKDFLLPKKIQRFFLYLDVSENGGTPKTPQNDRF